MPEISILHCITASGEHVLTSPQHPDKVLRVPSDDDDALIDALRAFRDDCEGESQK